MTFHQGQSLVRRKARRDPLGITALRRCPTALLVLAAFVASLIVGVPGVAAAAAPTVVAADNFNRVQGDGWGTGSGLRWQGASGATAAGSPAFRVDGSRGLVTLDPGADRRLTVEGQNLVSSTTRVETTLLAMPGGTGAYISLAARRQGTAEYRGTVRVQQSGRVSVLTYRLGGGDSILGSEILLQGTTYTAGQTLISELAVTGTNPTTLKMTVWQRGTPQPSPQISVQDGTAALQQAGAVGMQLRLSSTSPSPVQLAADEFQVLSDVPTAPPTNPPPPPAWGCAGQNVSPTQNLSAVVNAAGAGQTVCIQPGRHRLSVPLNPRSDVTLWGAPGAVLDGSIPLSNWVRGSTGWYVQGALPAAYSSAGECEDNIAKPCLIAEQVFQDGARLRRVMSLAALAAGTFYQDFAANRVWVGSDPSGRQVQMAKTRHAVHSSNARITVRGLTIERFATLGQLGTLFAGGPSWNISENTIRDNHAVGIHLSNSNSTTLSNNTISGNGQLGIAQHRSQSVVVRNNRITNNNAEGFWIADWESGGYKATWSSVSFTGNTVSDNAGVGVWLDVDCRGVTVKDNTIANNKADGIRFEISYDAVLQNNVISNNGFGMGRGGGTSIFATAGININSASNVEVMGNTVNNNMNGIALQMRNRGSGQYGLWALTNNRVHDNNVTMTVGTAWGQGASGIGQLGGTDYLTGKGNTFFSNDYTLDTATAKRFALNGTYVPIAQWKAAGYDVDGTVRFTG